MSDQHAPDGPPAATTASSPWPGLALAVAAACVAIVVSWYTPVSGLVAALIIGALIGNLTPTDRTAPGLTMAAKQVLRWGVVLLGLRLSLTTLADLGAVTLTIVVATVVATFFGTQMLGRRLGLSPDLSLLVAAGFSICGASAIAAVKETTRARDEEVAMAVALVTVCGTAAMVTLPSLGHLFDLADDQLAIWIGAAIHDVAQVVAAGGSQGSEVLAIAVAVKLTRVVMLAPMVAGLSLRHSRREPDAAPGSRPSPLPWFVIGFAAMVLVRTSGVLSDDVLDIARDVEKFVLAVSMVGLGAGVKLGALRRLGSRPLVLGALAWLLVSIISLAGVVIAR